MMLQDIAPYTFHIEYTPSPIRPQDYVLCYRKGSVLLKSAADKDVIPPSFFDLRKAGFLFEETDYQYLFAIDEIRFFLLPDTIMQEFQDFHYMETRALRSARPMWMAFAAASGFRLHTWYKNNRFCGRCGEKMVHSQTERALYCPDCGNTLYPAIAPSVIVAITHGEKLLLTRYQASHSAYRNYALVAGYIETGETAEDTVRREVMEEVGLKVKNIRYYKSQPWPFSGALLLGFFCELDGDDTITLEQNELSEAVWTDRADLPDRSSDVSLTSEMMECFRLGRV